MERIGTTACTICGKQRLDEKQWLLVAEDRWQDKLQILPWDEQLAERLDLHSVCNPSHLQQLAVHWMTTGSLDHPFAQSAGGGKQIQPRQAPASRELRLPANTKLLGELAVHRESMQRVLNDSPASLQSILDALVSVVQAETSEARSEVEWEQAVTNTISREV